MTRHAIRPIVRMFIGSLYPLAEPVGSEGRRCLYKWVVRSVRPIPDQDELDRLADALAQEVSDGMREAYAGAPAERLRDSFPIASLIRIDDRHLIAVVETATKKASYGDEMMISNWGFLHVVDRELGVEELQGLPKRFWFPLGGETPLGNLGADPEDEGDE